MAAIEYNLISRETSYDSQRKKKEKKNLDILFLNLL